MKLILLADFGWVDWCVIAVYAAGMLAIGWYFAVRTKSVDEYLLGGRRMKPWAVGISLFATLMSTVTYLAFPGEMIRHGPMILCSVLSYPIAYVLVGRFVIPSIMRLNVTSAYEVLEQRLGLSTRMLGSSFFLLLRLFWMSVIVFATSEAVLVPLLGLEPSATPWICVVLAAVTVVYTSMGGLRAVVVTDVVQTFIMLVGAVLSLVLITVALGGISQWWPHTWHSDWDAPSLWFAPESRVSAGMAVLSMLTWYICTAGSDQMAIQRYLSTRDAPSARRMFGIALICDTCVTLLLGALGFALFAYFKAHPELLPKGETLAASSDRLLAQFMIKALPTGVTGLVAAGILSAAMDSISSGLNASCSVITVDWLNRFRGFKLQQRDEVRQARLVSWVLGLCVVMLSLIGSIVPGNLLEMSFKVVNLLVAPLAVLFFMAMFVPWATTFGAWMGTLASVCVAVLIAFFQLGGLSFTWIMPTSLVAGMAIGNALSFIPGRKRMASVHVSPSDTTAQSTK